MQSDDQGQTWTFPRVLLDTALDDRDGGIMETSSGTLNGTPKKHLHLFLK